MQALLQPCWAVPKGTARFYRLITHARFANETYSLWGVSYTLGAQLSSTLKRCDFTFSVDTSDAYHLSLWAGCGGEFTCGALAATQAFHAALRRGPLYTTAAQLSNTCKCCVYIQRRKPLSVMDWLNSAPCYQLGGTALRASHCTSSTCRGWCDKDLSGIKINRRIVQFASCHFGQKAAGSLLGLLCKR